MWKSSWGWMLFLGVLVACEPGEPAAMDSYGTDAESSELGMVKAGATVQANLPAVPPTPMIAARERTRTVPVDPATSRPASTENGPQKATPGDNSEVPDPVIEPRLSNADDFLESADRPVDSDAPLEEQESPMMLTGSDGTGLVLREVEGRAVIDGPLAFTELHLVFHNPENRRREGRFNITLPTGAAISRFAMKIRGEWMEGEVVEKQKARQAYEDFLHRRQDPALLEQDAGNTFRARVFPIEAKEDKHIIISYSQTLASRKTVYALPLAGLPSVQKLSLKAFVNPGAATAPAKTNMGGSVSNIRVVSVDRKNYMPRTDFEVYPESLRTPYHALRNGNIAVARVSAWTANARDRFGRVVILMDTSASQSVAFEGRLKRLSDVIAAIGAAGATHLTVLAFDQEVDSVYDGHPSGFGTEQRKKLAKRGALGASDLVGALEHVARRDPALPARLVVFSDGVVTVGDKPGLRVKKTLKSLGQAGIERVDAVVMSSARDDAILTALVSGELKRDGVVVNVRSSLGELRRLALQTYKPVDVVVPGAKWVWPKRIVGLQTGEQVLIYADLPESEAFQIELSGGVMNTLRPRWRTAARPLLERAWVKARIDRLMSQTDADPDLTDSYHHQVVQLSTKHRVLSPLTALLVLEREWDYTRYAIDRRALTDILKITAQGVAVRSPRNPPTSPNRGTVNQPKMPESLETSRARGESGRMGDPNSIKLSGAGQRIRSRPTILNDILPAEGDPFKEATGDFEAGSEVGGLGSRGSGAGGSGHGMAAGSPSSARGGMSFRGQGIGGGGSGYGRIHGLGAIDTGGGLASLGRKSRVMKAKLRIGAGKSAGTCARGDIARVVRRRAGAIRACYEQRLQVNSALRGKLTVRWTVNRRGHVRSTSVITDTMGDSLVTNCVLRNIRRMRFPAPTKGVCKIEWPFVFNQTGDATNTDGANAAPGAVRPSNGLVRAVASPARFVPPVGGLVASARSPAARRRAEERRRIMARAKSKNALSGRMADIAKMGPAQALRAARKWQKKKPGDVLAYVALGNALARRGDLVDAARAYGSLLDLYPSRADLRRYAGYLLENVSNSLAVDTYRRALKQRPDHPTVYHQLAMALTKQGKHLDALEVLARGLDARRRPMNFPGAPRILREAMGLIGAAHVAQVPGDAGKVAALLERSGARLANKASLRVILTWETDANDVDFHIFDKDDHHVYYSEKDMSSGGSLLADITTGYGPEAFIVDRPTAYPYRLMAHYYSRGPMGYGMGRVQIIRYDGMGKLSFDERPFLVMKDGAWVNLGVIAADSST